MPDDHQAERDDGPVLLRAIVSPRNALLLVLAAAAAVWLLPDLPNIPRDGYSRVGVWLHDTHPGAPPGTPFMYGPHRILIETSDGAYRARLQHARLGDDDGWEATGAAWVYATRLREGLLAPTRETRGCTVQWMGARDWRNPDAELRRVPAEHQDRALGALIEMFREAGTMAGDQPVAVALEHYRAGRATQPPRPLADGVRANRVFLLALALMLVAVPGSVHAFLIAGRRVRASMLRSIGGRPHCPRCAYDLTGLESDRCPEYGARV